MTTLKFKKETFDIALRAGGMEATKGYVHGDWGIHKLYEYGWDVTHLKTGLKVTPEPLLTLRDAKSFLAEIIPLSDWEGMHHSDYPKDVPQKIMEIRHSYVYSV